MRTAEEIFLEFKELPPEEQEKFVELFYEFDDDIGLEEDAAEANRRYEAIKKSGGKDLVSLKEMRVRLGL